MIEYSNKFILICFLIAVVSSCSPAEDPVSQNANLLGAWLIVETEKTTADSTWTNVNPPQGVFIFTEHHFSLMLIPGDHPREAWPSDVTSDQRLSAFENFVADAGYYEASDSLLMMQNVIAKLPWAMDGNAAGPYRYWFDDDILSLRMSPGWQGEHEIVYRLERLGSSQ